MTTTAPVHRCPAIESSKFLCDRIAEYQIEGTMWCHIHARRVMKEKGL